MAPGGLSGTSREPAGWGVRALSPAACSLQFHCCGSNNSQDWRDSKWFHSEEADGRLVPDSCCKTVVTHCGHREHASNIYKVEVGGRGRGSGRGRDAGCGGPARLQRPPHLHTQGGCITKLETFIQEHLRVIGAVGIGIACVQVRAWGRGPGGWRTVGGRRPGRTHASSAPQVFGMVFTCCLYKSLKLEHY